MLIVLPGLSIRSHAHTIVISIYLYIYFLFRKAYIAITRGPHEDAGKSLGSEKPSRVERSFAKKILQEGREGRGGVGWGGVGVGAEGGEKEGEEETFSLVNSARNRALQLFCSP